MGGVVVRLTAPPPPPPPPPPAVLGLSKQQALDAHPRAIQQINITVNLDRAGNTIVFFIIEEAKETALDFSQWTEKVL